MIKFLSAFLLATAALLAGCGSGGGDGAGQTTPPAQAVVPFVPGTGYLEIDQPAINIMPQANSATLSLALDEGTRVLVISTPATAAHPVGQFVGGGTGNKAIVQFDGLAGLRVADLNSIELDAKFVSGTAGKFYMNFLVDLDCVTDEDVTTLSINDMRTQRRRIVVWEPSAGQPIAGSSYTRYSVSTTDSAWLIVGAPALGMGPNPSGPATPFALSGHPNACIVDGISADNGLMRNRNIGVCATNLAVPPATPSSCGLAHKGALLLLGDSTDQLARTYQVKRLKIKDREFVFR